MVEGQCEVTRHDIDRDLMRPSGEMNMILDVLGHFRVEPLALNVQ